MPGSELGFSLGPGGYRRAAAAPRLPRIPSTHKPCLPPTQDPSWEPAQAGTHLWEVQSWEGEAGKREGRGQRQWPLARPGFLNCGLRGLRPVPPCPAQPVQAQLPGQTSGRSPGHPLLHQERRPHCGARREGEDTGSLDPPAELAPQYLGANRGTQRSGDVSTLLEWHSQGSNLAAASSKA